MTKSARHSRESRLLEELQNTHGYRLALLPEKDSAGMMVALPTNKVRKPGTIRAVRCVRLSVPADSALGLALAKVARANRRPKAKRKS